MNRATTVTILIFLLCAFSTQGIPILGTQGRCKCIRTTSAVIHPKLIKSLRYIPSGAHCEAIEIIITLKNRKKVCVDPGAKWLHVLIATREGARHSN
ncbi:interleukin-8-like [Hemitrygon akajei]|uniref:interleukin-8-like n=1 Tax=Hemitrygon akajei TaxID=2704970 RepID=UPI003BF98C7E